MIQITKNVSGKLGVTFKINVLKELLWSSKILFGSIWLTMTYNKGCFDKGYLIVGK